MINKANSDPHSDAFREAMGGRLAACGAAGGVALADAFRRLASVGDTSDLASVGFSLAHNHSAAILNAALDVAMDARAPLPVRVLAVETALRQHRITRGFSGTLGEITAHPWGRLCKFDLVTGDDYISGEELDNGARDRTVTVLRAISADPNDSAVIRDLATCVVWELTENTGS